MDKITRQCPQTTTFSKRKESRSGIEPRSFRLPAYRLTARPNRLTYPRRWIIVFGNSMDTSFVYITILLGQPAGLSKEARLYAGAVWPKPHVLGEGEFNVSKGNHSKRPATLNVNGEIPLSVCLSVSLSVSLPSLHSPTPLSPPSPSINFFF